MAIKKVAVNNIVNDETKIPVHAGIDLTLAKAQEESVACAEHVAEVMTELEEKADAVSPEKPKEEKIDVKNMYTKLTLDESLNDFDIIDAKTLSDDDGQYDYLDYDMFDFIYGLVTDTYPKPKNPLDHRIRKFRYTGSDDYLHTNTNTGTSQVAVEGDAIVVYADTEAEFNDIKAICDLYAFKYEGPYAKRSSFSRWNFSFKIFVPMSADGYPMDVEDYFATIGLSLADVMEPSYVLGREKAMKKDQDAAAKQINDNTVDTVYTDYIHKAGNSNDPLENFINDMFAEMTRRGLTFNKARLKKAFLDEFNDDFED